MREQRTFAVVSMIIAAIACVGTWLALPQLQGRRSQATPTSESFDYQVRVQNQGTLEPIENAKVTIELGGGIAALVGFTDGNGLARIFIDASYVGRPGRIIVEADKYERFLQNIDLSEGGLPVIIQLVPLPAPSAITNSTLELPTEAATATNSTEPINTVNVENTFIEDFEDNRAQEFSIDPTNGGNWVIKDDGNNNMVLEAISELDTSSVRIALPERLLLLNGTIEYQIKYKNYSSPIDENTEDWGSFDLHFRKQLSNRNESYVLAMSAPFNRIRLTYTDRFGVWDESLDYETSFTFDMNVWYYVRLVMQGEEITAYLSDSYPAQTLMYSGPIRDTRLTAEGFINFLVRPHATVQFDNIKIIKQP